MKHDPAFYVLSPEDGKFWGGGRFGEFRHALKFSSVLAATLDARPCGRPFVVVTVELGPAGEFVSVNEVMA